MTLTLSERDTLSTLQATLRRTITTLATTNDFRLSTLKRLSTIDYETATGSAPVLSGVERVAVFLCGNLHDFLDFWRLLLTLYSNKAKLAVFRGLTPLFRVNTLL